MLAAKTLGYQDTYGGLLALMDEFKIDGWVDSSPNGDSYPNIALSGRQYLQNLGNEGRQVFGENFWIDQVLPDPARYDEEDKSDRYDELLEEMHPGVEHLLITDLRYPNEAERILHLGGVVWNVQRPGLISDGHASEQPLPTHQIDFTIYNSNDIDALVEEVELAISETL